MEKTKKLIDNAVAKLSIATSHHPSFTVNIDG
jgi:hypothetical protein